MGASPQKVVWSSLSALAETRDRGSVRRTGGDAPPSSTTASSAATSTLSRSHGACLPMVVREELAATIGEAATVVRGGGGEVLGEQ